MRGCFKQKTSFFFLKHKKLLFLTVFILKIASFLGEVEMGYENIRVLEVVERQNLLKL